LVKTGPESKLEDVENEILKLLMKNNEVLKHGLGFREIYRSLAGLEPERRPGSFSTLQKCLKNLENKKHILRDPVTRKYHAPILGWLAWLDRTAVKEIIKEANVFGGGRLCYPDVEIVDDGFRIPKEGVRPFGITEVFIVADLQGKYGLSDEGYLTIEVSDEYKLRRLKEYWPPSRKEGVTEPKSEKILPVYESILYEKLKPTSFLNRWLRDIFEFAKNEKLVADDFFTSTKIDKIPNEVLDRVWGTLFSGVKSILLTELLYPQRLLEWLKTPEGKTRLKEALKDAPSNRPSA